MKHKPSVYTGDNQEHAEKAELGERVFLKFPDSFSAHESDKDHQDKEDLDYREGDGIPFVDLRPDALGGRLVQRIGPKPYTDGVGY